MEVGWLRQVVFVALGSLHVLDAAKGSCESLEAEGSIVC